MNKNLFLNYGKLNDFEDFVPLIENTKEKKGYCPPDPNNENIKKYKDRIIKRVLENDKNIDLRINQNIFNFPTASGLASPIYPQALNNTMDSPDYPFNHELMHDDYDDEIPDDLLGEEDLKDIERDFRGSPEELEMLRQVNSDDMEIDDDMEFDDDNDFGFDKDEEIPESNTGGKKTRKKRKNKTKNVRIKEMENLKKK